jgi:glucose-6-phosphate 1-dehydrogenase
MVQNHLMQLLTLTAMEPPVGLDANSIRDEKVKVLRAIQPLTREEVATRTVRGQYTAARIGGEKGTDVKGYRQEERVNPQSETETFAAVKLSIDNWRWKGVPFYLRSGKRMPKAGSEICIHFKDAPGVLFAANQRQVTNNVLVLRVQPKEGISLLINAKTPGTVSRIAPTHMDFNYDVAFGSYSPEAYERLLLDAILGDSTLFIRDDEVEGSWRIIDSIEEGWANATPKLSLYPAGTWGPSEANELLARDEHAWDPLSETSTPDLEFDHQI